MSAVDLTLAKPGDIDTGKHFKASVWKKWEFETVASNLVFMCNKMGSEWCDFTWEDYEKECTHNVKRTEKAVIDGFVKTGHLSEKEGVYSFQKTFVMAVEPFRKKADND